jgi:drug/metabolite transporter (DMT)-like permease
MKGKEHHGFIYGILSAIASAVMTVFIRFAFEVPSAMVVFFRFLIALVLIIPLCYQKSVSFSMAQVPKHLTRALCGLAAMWVYISAVKRTNLIDAIALWNTAPLFLPFILLIWQRTLVSTKRFLTGLVGFAGVLFILRPSDLLSNSGNLLGLVNGLLSAISWVGIRQLSKTESTETILLYFFTISTALMVIPSFIEWQPLSLTNWLYIVGVGFFSCLNQYFLTKSYTHAPASKVSSLNYLTVIFGGLAGWWIFNEVPAFWDLFGVGLIILGGVLALLDRSEPRRL